MAQRFIPLDDAAEMLGISKEQLNAMREEGQVHAYRDGASWKFKGDEIDRLAAKLSSGNPEESAVGWDSMANESEPSSETPPVDQPDDDVLELADEDDSILLSEVELGESGPSSTVIGKNHDAPSADSDVKLVEPSDEGDELVLELEEGDDELVLELEEDDALASGTNLLDDEPSSVGAGASSLFEDIDELELDLEAESSAILSKVSSGSGLTGGDAATPAADQVGEADSSVVELEADEDDELVLGGAGDSDITLSSSDSGIGLADAVDSGLSLDEEPLDLAGSSVNSLELSDDAEISLEEDIDDEAATMLKTDDSFELTPLDSDADDDSSQVIEFDSETFDENAATMLGAALPPETMAGLEAEMGGLGAPLAAAAAAPLTPTATAASETPYTAWNITSLALCLLMLTLTGMMLFDLIRNMWSWNQPFQANSALMDALIKVIPIFN